MKTKYLLLVIGVVLVTGGVWFGRLAWRAHHELVTLDVRETPLADVLRRIEKQTWKKIRAERALDDVRITLHVTNRSLKYVLDRLAEQAGARWSKLYAVYDSARSLNALDSALRGDGKIESAGWTKIAPDFPPPEQPEPMEGGHGTGPVFHTGPDTPGPIDGGRSGMMMMRGTKGGPITVFGGPNGEVETWSAEELLMVSSLTARLGNERSQAATTEAAAETARKVDGKWTAYIAIKKSKMGIGFAGMHSSPPGSQVGPRLPNPNKRFADLTPEQRVEQARERRGLSRP